MKLKFLDSSKHITSNNIDDTKQFKQGGNINYFGVGGFLKSLGKSSKITDISKKVRNFLDQVLEVDLVKNVFPSGFSPDKYQLLRQYRKTYLDAKFGNSDFVSTAEKLAEDVKHTFGNNKKAINYIYAPVSEDVRKLFVKNEINNLPEVQTKMQRATQELNHSKEFDNISSKSVKHLNKYSDITIFPKPVTIQQLKNDIYKRYAREFEDLTGIKLSRKEVMNLSEATDRFQDVARLEEEMNRLGSKNYTVYGAVSSNCGSDYSGFILGTTKINKDDPAAKLMLEQIKNLRGSTISGEEFSKLEDAVINSVPKNKTYLYSSDNPNSGIGGYFNPYTGLNFVNTRINTPNTLKSTVIHEGLSHTTDSLIPDKIKKAYTDLVEVLNLQPNRRAVESENWEEIRATFNELKNKLAPDGKVSTLKKNVEKMDSDQLSWELSNINAYGQDYGDALAQFPKETVDVFKKAIIVLPATALAVLFGMDNNQSEEVPKAQEGIKLPEIDAELDCEEPIFIFRHLNDEYQAQDFDNDLTDFYYRGQINNGELTDKAKHKLQRNYNLNNIELKETLDDLHTAGLASVLNISPSYDVFKEGGKMIPKALVTGVDKLLSDATSKLKNTGIRVKQNRLTKEEAQ